MHQFFYKKPDSHFFKQLGIADKTLHEIDAMRALCHKIYYIATYETLIVTVIIFGQLANILLFNPQFCSNSNKL